eukprot:CAMPEP_0197849444 /NCGR_PEP_ID=MMETSP1438-20131217/12094_1 /TAXON_ID=1461541 /ORGANISM="Pterosperma sp., Strain CCMP1384" /LENGTH=384 /DNA_ID=CAMNT_0043462133 /DNA_START=67 /DNA_END=1221 /DNA_ORIENTATION=-
MNPLSPLPETKNRSVSRSIYQDPTGKDFIVLSSLPADIRAHLQVFDSDSSGLIEAAELAAIGRQHRDLQSHSNLLRKVVLLGATIGVILLLMSFGLSFAVYELSKETQIGSDDVMHTISGSVVQVGNTDMTVVGENLVSKTNGATKPVATSEALQKIRVTPNKMYTNEELSTFEEFEFEDGEHYFRANIDVAYRVPASETEPEHIVVVTPAGEARVNVANGEMSFDEKLTPTLKRAGFEIPEDEDPAPNGRKLHFFAVTAVATFLACSVVVGVAASDISSILSCFPASLGEWGYCKNDCLKMRDGQHTACEAGDDRSECDARIAYCTAPPRRYNEGVHADVCDNFTPTSTRNNVLNTGPREWGRTLACQERNAHLRIRPPNSYP